MLRRHQEVFRTTLIFSDLCLLVVAWLGAYLIRFFTIFPSPQGIPDAAPYNQLLLLILPLWFVLFRAAGLYDARRGRRILGEPILILRSSLIGISVLVGVSFFAYVSLSRTVVLIFFLLTVVSISVARLCIRLALRALRRRGYNLRYALVVGGGRLAEDVIERFTSRPELGIRVLGVLSTDGEGSRVAGVPVLGGYRDIRAVLDERRIDQVVVALPGSEAEQSEGILDALEDATASVRLIPDLPKSLRLRSTVEDFDGLPMVALRESPFVGWAGIQKRIFDVLVSGLGLLVGAPVLLAIAGAVWVSSGRPILYVQERVGLDGRVFRMFKFRTMRADAEQESGPTWTAPDDPRRTRLGAFLRETSLDELPQLWNVLRGDMSLVGPRPERPVFIEEFRKEIPGYMLRHKVKSGVTGWAQVHGWRGDTCLDERVDHDMYYIENWSLALDVRILLMTLWRGMLHRNAY